MDHSFRARDDRFKPPFAGQTTCQETLQAGSPGQESIRMVHANDHAADFDDDVCPVFSRDRS